VREESAVNVPFLDLKAQYSSIRGEIAESLQKVLDSCAFAGGHFAEQFEKEWAGYCGVKHVVAVGSGTDAIWLALLALGIGAGDEVVTVPMTFMATAEAITMTGAKPVFVDIEGQYYTMDPNLLEAAITPRTKAVIPVHLFGQPADLHPISDIARRHGIALVEDACQAHGATYVGAKVGSFGDAAAFSFYPGKNLGAYGEAGAVATDRDDLAAAMRMLRDHGQSRKYYHDAIGWNARMDGIQGAVLSVKLKHLDEWNEKRRQWAAAYDEEFARCRGIVPPARRPNSRHVYHVYCVRVKERDRAMAALQAEGIGFGVHYPVALHEQKAYASLDAGPYPVAESCAQDFLSLPMYPEMGKESVKLVAQVLARACSAERGDENTRLVAPGLK
jgi:dTDP-4-amino-4,6-dideoxygalactose transaminase